MLDPCVIRIKYSVYFAWVCVLLRGKRGVGTLFHNWANVLCYPDSGLPALKRHPYGSRSKHGIIPQFCSNVGPASNTIDQQWVAMLAQHWTGIGWVGLHCVYQVRYRHVYIHLIIHLSALVVEGIGLQVEDILVSLVLSMIIIISWTFRILAHEENQYSYVCKILGHFFV